VSQVTDDAPDETLLRRFNEGDAAAFEALMGRYERPLFNFVLRYVGDRQRSEEILQDTFLRVLERSRDFKGESKVSTWLYTIARNLCIDESRKRKHRKHRSLDAPGTTEEDGPALVERVPARGPAVDRAVIAETLGPQIAAAIEGLPEEQREVFLMRETQAMPFKDIAAVVGVPENTVKSRMRYALERLQEALREYEDYVRELE
jgi:RNA polymerase sigma-70 factor (ECF subfamily)